MDILILKVMHISIIVFLVCAIKNCIHVEAEEICNDDKFEAGCSEGHVVQITSAQYGRIQVGQCIENDQFGNIGPDCSQEVKGHMERLCSGRQVCRVKVGESLFPDHVPCHKELKGYLQVEYTCLKVITSYSSSCERNQAELISERTGYIASDVTYQTGCGSTSNPWLIRAQSGEQIKLTLIDYTNITHRGAVNQHATECSMRVYATAKDIGTNVASPICRSNWYQQKQEVLVSTGNELEIRIMTHTQSAATDTPHFLLHFEVIGCSDLEVVKQDETIDRFDSNNLQITCLTTGHVTNMICEDDTWIGHRKHCPPGVAKLEDEQAVIQDHKSISNVISIVIIIAIAICISVFILCIGVLCLKRNSQDRNNIIKHPQHNMKLIAIQDGVGGKPESKVLYQERELSTVGRRHERMRQLYAHTAELHPDRVRHTDVTPQHTSGYPQSPRTGSIGNPHAHSHIYECPSELVRQSLLASTSENPTGDTSQVQLSRDFEHLCRLCGLDERGCIHSHFECSEILPKTAHAPPRTTNNYSV